LCGQLATERVGLDVVDERLLAVDLDHREEVAVAPLELRVAGDVDLAQLEPELIAQLVQRRAGSVAQVAAGRVVKDDVRDKGRE
jgi:hypothetical protein